MISSKFSMTVSTGKFGVTFREVIPGSVKVDAIESWQREFIIKILDSVKRCFGAVITLWLPQRYEIPGNSMPHPKQGRTISWNVHRKYWKT